MGLNLNRRELLLVFSLSVLPLSVAFAAPGDWPEPRQNPCLTAIQLLPGAMKQAPQCIAGWDLGRSRPAITVAHGSDGRPVGLCIVAGSLFCYDTAGGLLWKSHPPGLNCTSIIATEDLDGDGRPEVLLTAGRPTPPFGAAVVASLGDGRIIWRYDVEPMSYAWYLYSGHYLPGVASKQILVVMQGYPPDEKNGYMALFEYPHPASAPKQKWRYDFSAYTCFPSLLQSDLDSDGVKELVIESHSRMWILDAVGGRLKQFVEWEVAPANHRSYGLVRFVDLNGDGREDFLCIADFAQHHEVLLNRNGTLQKAWHHGWPESVTTGKVATTWPEPPYADLDGDGRFEIVVSMFNSESESAWLLRVYDAVTGTLKYRCPGVIAVSCLDIDGDGKADIAANSSSDSVGTAHGARVLRFRDGHAEVMWRDDKAEAVAVAAGQALFRRGDPILSLRKNPDGQLALSPWLPPAAEPMPDFSAVPALQGPPAPVLLAADVDGDGVNELLLYQEPNLQVLRLGGGTLKRVARYRSASLPVVADLNGDGKRELVLADVGTDSGPVVQAITPALQDRILWRTVFPRTDRQGLPAPRKAYARPIHLTGRATPDLYVWAGTPLVRSVGLEGLSGRILWEKGEIPNSERYWGPSMNLASAWDFNGDGKEDLVFTNPDSYCIADGPTGEFLLGPTSPAEIFKQPSQGLYTCPVILKTPGRFPTVCLSAGHYFQAAMSLDAAPSWYKLPVTGENRSGMEGFLRLRGGSGLMGFGRQNGNFACVDVRSGRARWELPVNASVGDVVSGDVDGDGEQEFVFGTSHGDLYAVGQRDDAPHVLWKTSFRSAVDAVIIADLNADGHSEVIVATADGHVRVLGSMDG